MKILMKMRNLATVPLRTDDRNAPLVVGTPRSEQVAKKTENAANAKIKTGCQKKRKMQKLKLRLRQRKGFAQD